MDHPARLMTREGWCGRGGGGGTADRFLVSGVAVAVMSTCVQRQPHSCYLSADTITATPQCSAGQCGDMERGNRETEGVRV